MRNLLIIRDSLIATVFALLVFSPATNTYADTLTIVEPVSHTWSLPPVFDQFGIDFDFVVSITPSQFDPAKGILQSVVIEWDLADVPTFRLTNLEGSPFDQELAAEATLAFPQGGNLDSDTNSVEERFSLEAFGSSDHALPLGVSGSYVLTGGDLEDFIGLGTVPLGARLTGEVSVPPFTSARVDFSAFGDLSGTVTLHYTFDPAVIIDIKPGTDPNSINCDNENGIIAVAILTTDDFDATMVDHTTVTFEGANEVHVNNKSGEPKRHEKDVDGDGDIDLVFHFRLGDTGLSCDSTEGMLLGETFDGIALEGTDAVLMSEELSPLPPLLCDTVLEQCDQLVPFEPDVGEGYIDYHVNGETADDQYRSYIRRDVMYAVKYAAAKVARISSSWIEGNGAPIGLGDMSEADGSIPGTSIGMPGQPAGTHEDGTDIDTSYYQLFPSPDNFFRPVCPNDIFSCTGDPDILDAHRTALFIAALAEHPNLRAVAVDPMIHTALSQALNDLVNDGIVSPEIGFTAEGKLINEPFFHHQIMHISFLFPST